MTTLEEELRNLGYIRGQNLALDFRWADGDNERFPRYAAELVALKPDLIVAETTPGAIAARKATATIPIVIVNVSDPVGAGLVASLARPGGNVTGSVDFGLEIAVKVLDLLHSLLPGVTRIAVLVSDNPVHASQLKAVQDAALRLGTTILPTTATTIDDFEAAFASMAKQRAGALIVLGGAPFSTPVQTDRLVELAIKHRLPPILTWSDSRGLMGYGPSQPSRWQLTAAYVDKILKGAKPADLPIEQPTKLELVVNLQVAKALGLTIPPTLLQRADRKVP